MCESRGCCEEPHGHHGHGTAACCCGPGFQRRFMSKEERISRLEAYRQELAREMEEVDKRLAELKSSK